MIRKFRASGAFLYGIVLLAFLIQTGLAFGEEAEKCSNIDRDIVEETTHATASFLRTKATGRAP